MGVGSGSLPMLGRCSTTKAILHTPSSLTLARNKPLEPWAEEVHDSMPDATFTQETPFSPGRVRRESMKNRSESLTFTALAIISQIPKDKPHMVCLMCEILIRKNF